MSIHAVHANLDFALTASFKNGIHRIVDDVEEYLLDLVRVGHHQRRFGRGLSLNGNIVDLEIVVAQCQSLVENLAHIHFLALRFALTGK